VWRGRWEFGKGIARVPSVDRDHGVFRRALEISILLHLLGLFVLAPQLVRVWPASSRLARKMAIKPQPTQEKPLEFELVDIPTREEKPPEEVKAPLSDMDRRAHGGESEETGRKPAVKGNTPELVQAQGGRRLGRGAPPVRPGPRTVPQPRQQQPRRAKPSETQETRRKGAGEEQRPNENPQAPRAPAIQLPPPGAVALPPDWGGMPERPNRRGAQVDTGALSFDTRWYDWGPYAAEMLRKIRRNWNIPEIAQLGVSGVVKVRFFIERDGTVSGLRIMDESGKPPMDFAARDAIADSSPFKALPADLTGVEHEGVTITFYYNTHPPDWEGE
jgi:TonB family protein